MGIITTGNTPVALGGTGVARRKWMQPNGPGSTVVKHPGALHRALHVPIGQKIPEKKMAAGSRSKSPRVRKMVGLAHAFAHSNHGGRAHHA